VQSCAAGQAGGHEAALRILALVQGDVAAAEAYCAAHLGPPGYAQLLALLLDARLLPEACHLLRFAGAPAAACACRQRVRNSQVLGRPCHRAELHETFAHDPAATPRASGTALRKLCCSMHELPCVPLQ
jgi:hypothetical protein